MRTKSLLGILGLFLCIFSITSCDNDDDKGRKITNYKEYILTVASEKVPGVLTSDGYSFLTDVYAVKKELSNEWSSFGNISGFDFEEEYEHKIRISETSYLDYSMGEPAWTEYEQLEVISKEKRTSEGLSLHFIPDWYYKDQFKPEYKYAVEADAKELIEEDLKDNSILPLNSYYLIYNTKLSKWIIIDAKNNVLGKGVLKRINQNYEEFPESYKILVPEGTIRGYMEWTFLDELGKEAIYPPFDVFLTEKSKAKSDYKPNIIPYLYSDLTEYYKSKYPKAGVKAVVVSYTLKQ